MSEFFSEPGPGDMPMSEALALARDLGSTNGRAAASWVFDGNSTDETYAAVQKALDDGDPAIDDLVTEPSFRNGDYSERDLYSELGLDYDASPTSEQDKIADAYMEEARAAFWPAVEAAIAGHFGVAAYRCPCCGEDVMDTGPICGACREAGCEKTTDAAGEPGYWECQKHE